MAKNDLILDFEVSMKSSHSDASVGEGVGWESFLGGLELGGSPKLSGYYKYLL